jgi:hypothetical protein
MSSNAQRPQDPEQAPPGVPGVFLIQSMKDKAEACRDMAECSVCPVQLDMISSLVSNQIVHVTVGIGNVAEAIRGFYRSADGDTERAESQLILDDLKTILDDLCSVACQITEKLEGLGAA